MSLPAKGSLNLRTLELMRNRPRHLTYEHLATEVNKTGCKPINVNWIHCYIAGRTGNVDVDRIQALYEVLSGKILNVE